MATTLALGSVAWACAPLAATPTSAFTYVIDSGHHEYETTDPILTYDPRTHADKDEVVKLSVAGYLRIPPNLGDVTGNSRLYLGNVTATAADNQETLYDKCYPAIADDITAMPLGGDLVTEKVPTQNAWVTAGRGEIPANLRPAGTYMMCSGDRIDYWKALITIV